MKYLLVEWPEIQQLMDKSDFNEHTCLVNDESWVDQYGYSSYFVEEDWLKENKDARNL